MCVQFWKRYEYKNVTILCVSQNCVSPFVFPNCVFSKLSSENCVSQNFLLKIVFPQFVFPHIVFPEIVCFPPKSVHQFLLCISVYQKEIGVRHWTYQKCDFDVAQKGQSWMSHRKVSLMWHKKVTFDVTQKAQSWMSHRKVSLMSHKKVNFDDTSVFDRGHCLPCSNIMSQLANSCLS